MSSDVSQSYLTPSLTTLLTLLTKAWGVYDNSFPRANTVLQYVQEPRQPALTGILKLRRQLHFNLFALSHLWQVQWWQFFFRHQLHFVSLQGLLHDFHNSVNLSHTHSAHVLQLGNSLLTLRNAACHNNRLFYFLCLADHVNKCTLRWVYHSTTVDQHQICILRVFHHFIPVLWKLPNHELTVGNVMGTAKGLDKNAVSTGCFLAFY